MKKVFVGIVALLLIAGLSANDAFAGKGVKYTEGSGGGGSIEGTVFAKGTMPPYQEIVIEKNPDICDKPIPGSNIPGKRIVDPWQVGGNGELHEAVVYIQDIKTGKKWPTNSFKMDQKACSFQPYIDVMRNKKELEVVNLDPIGHNIHTYQYIGTIKKNKLEPGGINMTILNIGQPDQGFTFKKKIKLRKDNQMKLECDIHNFMHGWRLVLENPYYSETNEDGSFKIDGIPAGTYKVIAWHPTFGVQEQSITVSDGAASKASFELTL